MNIINLFNAKRCITISIKDVYNFDNYSVMGDIDRSLFSFNKQLTDDELLSLLIRNPTVNLACNWMTYEAIKFGFNFKNGDIEKYNDYLNLINFSNKLHKLIMFSRLHGSSIAVLLNDNPNLEGISEEYNNFEVYHKLAHGNGFYIDEKDIDSKGQPKYYTIRIKSQLIGNENQEYKVPIDRVVVFNDIKKEIEYEGTPTSRLIAKLALVEELIIKLMAKSAIDIASPFWFVSGVKNNNDVNSLHNLLSKVSKEIYVSNPDIEIEPKTMDVTGTISDLINIGEYLKRYIARGLRVSLQAMDGAPEGTISSAQYNTLISYGAIQQIQTHYKPQIEKLLGKLGIHESIIWIDPLKEMESKNNNEEYIKNKTERPSL